MKVAVAGLGFVGSANAALLSTHNDVIAVDINKERVEAINNFRPPVDDAELEHYLSTRPVSLRATTNAVEAYKHAGFVVVATPTDYDPKLNFFNTSLVEAVIAEVLSINGDANIVIKSTIPVGFCKRMAAEYPDATIFHSPEFLREGSALFDNLHPSRIVVGDKTKVGEAFAQLLLEAAFDEDVPVLLTDSTEAEAIKLFSNTYLAMRVAFFNELDSYAISTGLQPRQIIEGVGLDPRIGNHYNNPSFGYGGYCLPKDTKQLLANYDNVPQRMFSAIVEANGVRKDFLTEVIMKKSPNTVGVFRLVMKTGADNFRSAAIQGIMTRLQEKNVRVVVYEPALEADDFYGYPHIQDLEEFKQACDVIIANRFSLELKDVSEKVFTRDIFQRD